MTEIKKEDTKEKPANDIDKNINNKKEDNSKKK